MFAVVVWTFLLLKGPAIIGDIFSDQQLTVSVYLFDWFPFTEADSTCDVPESEERPLKRKKTDEHKIQSRVSISSSAVILLCLWHFLIHIHTLTHMYLYIHTHSLTLKTMLKSQTRRLPPSPDFSDLRWRFFYDFGRDRICLQCEYNVEMTWHSNMNVHKLPFILFSNVNLIFFFYFMSSTYRFLC